MAEEKRDDLSPTTPSGRDEKDPPNVTPKGDTGTENIKNTEAVQEDELINDRFQATDN